MKIFKSHFWYNKNQRNGVFLLVIIIALFQVLIFFYKDSSKDVSIMDNARTLAFYKKIDSLKLIALESRKPKLYHFNPNYITDYKGAQLGMSINEIDKLLAYRKRNQFVNSKEEFQEVTNVSDSLLNRIAPYFKFPDWVTQQKTSISNSTIVKYSKKKNKTLSTTDINKATLEDFKTIDGVGDKISARIIKYRSKLQGFSMLSQLDEIWGVKPEILVKIKQTFKLIELPYIQKINVNTASFKEILKTPYVDYELCKKIFEYRDEVAELQNISQLKNISGFPLDLYDRIVLYLVAK
ncbi:hypothetical protein BXQ17_00860 [Polaribacter sp. BM10]|uniref:ComEA family DNA-binding protein n=1 Tax=Polaribacter sp. BM10 TaxID=1529069 RepID=UPI000989D44D|nr:helix-hairpin-helix domain-containing protein [Polaribacter sp. BM10]AQS92707.1 hypothetical protein BXQ17_00860 [Polaribacter sp. BM10]